MNPILVGAIVLAFTLGGACVGNMLRTTLSAQHLDGESRDTVKLGIGLIATMTALVLGLITASTKSSFDGIDAAVKHNAADILAIDRLLARYGPETAEIRRGMKAAVSRRIEMVWHRNGSQTGEPDPFQSGTVSEAEQLSDAIRKLVPRDDYQRALQARAVDLAEGALRARWDVFEGGGTSVPTPFLVILLFWLTLTFVSFGLFAPRNGTVFAMLLACALSVASAVFLILELDRPFDGMIQVSSGPFHYLELHLGE